MPRKSVIDFGTAEPIFGPAVSIPEIVFASHVRGQEGKYHNRICQEDGYTFGSKKELSEYRTLKSLEAGGAIRELSIHPVYQLLGPAGDCIYTYTADFSYLAPVCDTWVRVVMDVKSVATRAKDSWRIVRKLFRSNFGFDITEA